MGIAMLMVVGGYLVFCVLFIKLVAFSLRGADPRTALWTRRFLVFLAAWPLWVFLTNRLFFELACAVGSPGPHIYQPIRVETFRIEDRDRIRQWTVGAGGTVSLWPCKNHCESALNELISPWSAVRSGSVNIETRWQLLPQEGTTVKYARLWVAARGDPSCIAAVPESRAPSANSKCIAGTELSKFSTAIVLVQYPFMRPREFTSGTFPSPDSMEWRWFGVEKHQHQLLENGKVVAKFIWYWRNLMPNSALGSSATCPANVASSFPGAIGKFLEIVVANNGAPPNAKE
jgi:hypothetical protein